MGKPIFTDCPANEWSLVATGVLSVRIWRVKTDPKYLFTYAGIEDDAPTNRNEGVPIFTQEEQDYEDFPFTSPTNFYVYPIAKAGRVRADIKKSGVTGNAVTAFGEVSATQFQPQTGWTFPYNINRAIVSIVELFGGTVIHEGSFAKMQTGTDPNGVAFIRSNRPVVYAPGVGAVVRFTAVFSAPVLDNQQLQGVGNAEDGWFFGYDVNTKFGVMKRRGGIDEWYYQEDWSEDTRASLNPLKGNVFQIKYQWLGFGMQYFGIENSNGDIATVHRIKYANLNDNVSIENASLPLSAGVANIGNTSNVILKTPSAVGGLEGVPFSPVFEALVAHERIFTIPGAGEHYLFGLQNPDQWLGKDNRLYISPKIMTGATDLNKAAIIRVYFNPTIVDPVWVDVEPDISPLQYDESGTFVLNGESKVFTLPMARVDTQTVYLDQIDAEIQSRQIFAITVESTSTTGDVVVGINFKSRT